MIGVESYDSPSWRRGVWIDLYGDGEQLERLTPDAARKLAALLVECADAVKTESEGDR